MHIHLFPRPQADTGIALHWCAGRSQLSIQQLRSVWLPAAQALGVAWIKLNDHRESRPLIEALLTAGIQPIVRIYRPTPHPGRLSEEDLAGVDELVRIGVRYFESCHRPDLPAQWRSGVHPPDAKTLVARHLAQDMEALLGRGALPALPGVDPASGWDLITELIRLGKRDILQGPIWQAAHTPGYNRPPDYPTDGVNREGAPLSQNLYLALAEEEWGGDAWQGRSLADVNRQRRKEAETNADNEDRTVAEPGGLFNFSALHSLHLQSLGRGIPILATSGGYGVGSAEDPRYPALTPSLHMAYTLEACRAMMGTSNRFAPTPDYLFCSSFGLLANRALESSRPARESEVWYSPDHPQGVLPIVPVLQAETKRLRHSPQVFKAEAAPPSLPGSQEPNLFGPALAGGSGLIAGRVRGGASVQLSLINLESGLFLQTIARSNGDYRFVDLPAGRYSVWVENPPGSRRRDVVVEGEQSVAVDLAVDGWGYEVSEAPDGDAGMLQCSVALTADMAAAPSLRLRWVGGERVLAMVRSGKDRTARCSAGPLDTGIYDLELLGIPDSSPSDLRASIPVGRAAETHVHFVHTRPAKQQETPRNSVIEGQVINGEGAQVILHNAEGRRRSVTADPRGRFRFPGLAQGSYSLTVTGNGHSRSRNRLGVDGENALSLRFELPPLLPPPASRPTATGSVVQGHAPGQAGRVAILTAASGLAVRRRIDSQGHFLFSDLPAGEYHLLAGELRHSALVVSLDEKVTIEFPPPTPFWQVQMRSRAVLRRPGLVRVQVLGLNGTLVTLAAEKMADQTRPTGSALDYGPFAVEFGPLAAGDYRVSVEGVDVIATFTLESTDAAVITFLRNSSPGAPARLLHQPL
ncbi:MAG: carboxypeptidase regulatory-like domain-containing protein [Caldilineaceae bacterium]|nr:carboxypeptidase regulatory-like domain-containing protein [Caldilineaceae bacterium]